MDRNHEGGENANLDALWRAYRDACPAPDASANFMPALWRRIEERQHSQFFLGRWARALVTSAAVLSLGMAAYVYLPRPHAAPITVESYVEASAASHGPDIAGLVDPSLDER